MSRRRLVAAAFAAALFPAAAFGQAAPAAGAVATQATVDPARLSAAEPVIGKLVPLGVYKRLLGDNFHAMMESAVGSLGDMSLQQLVRVTGISAEDAAKLGEGTMRELMEVYDPHWQERLTLSSTAMGDAMGKMMGSIEPAIRKALARAYAREFSLAELHEMDRFFSTPAGSHYAAKSLEITMDPEMMKAMTEIMPQIMEQLPEIIAEVQAAEKALPPVRKFEDLTPAERKKVSDLLGVDPSTLEENARSLENIETQ